MVKRPEYTHSHEEILEHLWIYLVEDRNDSINLNDLKQLLKEYDFDVKGIVTELWNEGDLSLSEGFIVLTENGKTKGKQIVRKQRLAERLLFDVLDLSSEKINKVACSFEHVLSEDVEENVCTLLGHPSMCPHEKAIPSGKCCKNQISITSPAVIALANVDPGHEAIVSYITTKKHKRLQKLMSFGILPGSRIQIMRKSPGTVIKFDETMIALEPSVTRSIFLRKIRKISNRIS